MTSEERSRRIKEGFVNRTDTFEYKIKSIDKEEFIREYIEENKPRTYIMQKYNISSYMLDRIINYFDCHKNKSNSATLGYQTKLDIYGSDNINNWKKGHETRINNYGSLEESYKQGLENKRNTMLERYGVACAFNLDYLKNHRKKKNSKPNENFYKLLLKHGLTCEREFNLDYKSYDFKIGNTLVEINPTITHNSTFIPYGDYHGLDKNYHKNKTQLAVDNNYRCINIWDWDNLELIIKQLLPRERIYARNCTIKEVTKYEAKDFLNKNHLQGYAKDNIRIGLYYNDQLVSIMTFDKPRYNKNYQYELVRYCSTHNITGGAEKLFKNFLLQFNPESIISYCDLSKFKGDTYYKLGFTLKHISVSKHWYNIKTKQHITDNLLRQRGFDQLLGNQFGCFGKGTDNQQLMLAHGFLDIYDCGQATFVYNSSK